MIRILLCLSFFVTPTLLAAESVNVKSAGAVGDGKTLDTASIQKAIDRAATSGGGTVTLPAGQYLCGTIVLKDNITLHLDEGAELLGTPDLSQYKNLDPFKDGLGAEVGTAFVVAVDAKNVTIEGKGTLNGNGKAVAAAKSFKGEGWGFRPMLLRLVRCENVKLQDVTLRDSASWTTNFFQCKTVTADHVTINSHVAPHNDGFDIDSCDTVTITYCDVESGDDAMCLKSTAGAVCRNISASDNRLKSNQGAIKLGTESYGGFEHVRISDCQIRDTKNGGIKVLCVDGGTLSDVIISDITMDNVKTPIFVRLGVRQKTFRSGDEKKPIGALKDVTIKNVKAKADPNSQIMPPTGIFITGIPDHRIENLTLENITIDLAGGGTAQDANAKVDEKPDTYPEINRFGKTLPAYGVFARHVNGLKLTDITCNLASPDARPGLVCEDVDNIDVSGGNLTAK
jgi:polygalacturonase